MVIAPSEVSHGPFGLSIYLYVHKPGKCSNQSLSSTTIEWEVLHYHGTELTEAMSMSLQQQGSGTAQLRTVGVGVDYWVPGAGVPLGGQYAVCRPRARVHLCYGPNTYISCKVWFLHTSSVKYAPYTHPNLYIRHPDTLVLSIHLVLVMWTQISLCFGGILYRIMFWEAW